MTSSAPNTLRIGDLEVLSVFDGAAKVPATAAYQMGPPGTKGGDDADWEPHRDLLDDGTVEFVFGGFVIRGAGDRVLLVDGGIGAVEEPPHGMNGGQLLASLAAADLSADDVTDVLFTHLHFDHIGWASTDGVPVFPRATYRCDVRDWDHFVGSDNFATERLRPVEDRLETWDGDTTIAPGIDARLCAGHTPGSTLIVLSSGEQRAMLLGDVVHCAVELLDDEWGGVADVDPDMAQRARNALARELEGTDVPVAAAHFPGLKFGRVLSGRGRRQWVFD
ncbi:MAG TPA: MBL fold metallo-hydrolase [Acidimicrobiia bacterium]|nr:MBL fold metallo-hydrolase [Acidimicrobiia bacterium]